MAMGLGAFTEGLSSGIQTRDRMDIAKQYKEELRQKNAQGAIDLQANYDMGLREAEAGGTEEDFMARHQRYMAAQDPALIRFGKYLGSKLGMFGGQKGPVAAPAQEEAIPTGAMSKVRDTPQLWEGQNPDYAYAPQRTSVPAEALPNNKLVGYADGGAVDEERMKRSYGDYYVTEEEAAANRAARSRGEHRNLNPYHQRYGAGVDRQGIHNDLSGGGIMEGLRDVGRHTAAYFDDTVKGADTSEYDEVAKKWGEAKTAREYGAAAGPMLWEAGEQMVETTKGLAKDLFVDNPVTQFGIGLVTGEDEPYDPAQDAAAPTSQQSNGEGAIPEEVGPPVGLGVGEEKKTATDATAPAPRRTDTEMADQAIDDGTMQALENLDFRTLTSQGLTPNDLPQMSTQEWREYRQGHMSDLIMKGKDPSEALKIVDDLTVGVQMRGFQRYGTQAAQYLMAGLQDEAAMAMSMAFQYFPNGVSVQWANFTDPKTGQAALVARGVDEKTGEPKGPPQLITAERLTVMMDQFQNPNAFRTWTLDNRELQLDVAKHKETVSHNKSMEGIYSYGAETDRMNAQTRRMYPSGYGGDDGGIKPSEQRLRTEAFKMEMKELMMGMGYEEYFEDPRVRQEMVNVLDGLQMRYPRASTGQLVNLAMRAFDGGMQQGGNVESALRAVDGLLAVPETG